MRKAFKSIWFLMSIALVIGLVVGGLLTRWHYKTHYKNYVACGSISYYDKTGKTQLYSEPSCGQ